MRKAIVICLVVLGVFAFNTAALAEGLTVTGEISAAENTLFQTDLSFLLLGTEYSESRFIFGGWCAANLQAGAGPYNQQSELAFSLYGACRLLGGEVCSLATVLGCYSSRASWHSGADWDYQIMAGAAGLRCDLHLEPVSISAVYLIGVNHKYTLYMDGWEMVSSNNLASSYFEFKGVYQFNETWGLYLAYRSLCWDVKPFSQRIETSGLGLGVQIAF